MEKCLFCEIPPERVIARYGDLFAIYDSYPVSDGHTLIISNRCINTFFELSQKELRHAFEFIDMLRISLWAKDSTINGYNVGMNCGESAGQTIMHCHIHLIPRRHGDTPNPRGGVRGVIPHKMNYY